MKSPTSRTTRQRSPASESSWTWPPQPCRSPHSSTRSPSPGRDLRLEDAEIESMERTEGFDSQKSLADEAVRNSQIHARPRTMSATETIDAGQATFSPPSKKNAKRSEPKSTKPRSPLRPHPKAKDRSRRSPESKVHGLPDDASTTALERPPRSRQRLAMMTCESCGRMLYYDPARDSPQRKDRLRWRASQHKSFDHFEPTCNQEIK